MRFRTPLFAILAALTVQLAACSDLTRPDDAPARPAPPGAELHDAHEAGPVTVVTGQNDAAIDVPAVQQAVDAGGTVVLRGTFSFEGVNHPGPDVAPPLMLGHVILVANAVTIRGEDAEIVGSGVPAEGEFQAAFLVHAPAEDITIEGLRFVEPSNAAIRVVGAGDLRIADSEVDGVTPTVVTLPFGSLTAAAGLHVLNGPFGAVTVLDNQVRVGGSEEDVTSGINISGPSNSVEVVGNQVDETTSHAISLRDVEGPALIERNVVVTGPVGRGGGEGEFVDALRVLGTGEYRILHNELDCAFGNGAVVRVAATTNAVVRHNEIVSSIPEMEEPGAESAGVQVRGSATGNEVSENLIHGRGRVAISVVHSDFGPDKPYGTDGNPADNTFVGNAVQQFDAAVATIEVGEGARSTTIIGGSGTLIDDGVNTTVHGDFRPPG